MTPVDANFAKRHESRRNPGHPSEDSVDLRDSAAAHVAAAYDSRAAEYVEIGGRIDQMDDRDVALIRRWRDATPGMLLDAGCGPGHWTRFLAEPDRDVVGVDISTELLRTAGERHPALRFTQESLGALSADDASVGGILAWYSLIHTDPARVPVVLREFARMLAPGGSLLLGFFDGEPGTPFDHAITTAYFWSADALAELLADAGFEVVFRERRERESGEMSVRPHAAIIARRQPAGA